MSRVVGIVIVLTAFSAAAMGQTRTVPGVTTPVPLPGVGGAAVAFPMSIPGATLVDSNGNLLITTVGKTLVFEPV